MCDLLYIMTFGYWIWALMRIHKVVWSLLSRHGAVRFSVSCVGHSVPISRGNAHRKNWRWLMLWCLRIWNVYNREMWVINQDIVNSGLLCLCYSLWTLSQFILMKLMEDKGRISFPIFLKIKYKIEILCHEQIQIWSCFNSKMG